MKRNETLSRTILIAITALMLTAYAAQSRASCLNPKQAPAWVLTNVKEYVAKDKDRKLVTWDAFLRDVEAYVDETIIIDEYTYGRSNATEGITELVRRYQGQAFALTWNTGIALTRNDYNYAEQRYQLYVEKGEQYSAEKNLKAVPIYPKWHLGPLVQKCQS